MTDEGLVPGGAPAEPVPLLRLEGIFKAFDGVLALADARFALRAGEIHGLAGENGAGKSTLVRVISGALVPDAGTIEVNGQPHERLTPSLARRLGIAVVYQEFNLLPDLSAAENIFTGALPGGRLLSYSPRACEVDARALLRRLGSDLDVTRTVGDLTVAEQQVVEIAKALALDARIIVMDEPSTVLGGKDLNVLHDVVRRLRAEGRGVLYISHHLDELLALSDRITVFKDGRHVSTHAVADIAPETLIRDMIGRALVNYFPERTPQIGNPVLRVDGLTVPGKLADISVSVREGEIVGLAGLRGAGKTSVARALFGLDRPSSGTIELDGHPAPRSTRGCAARGIVLVPEDRTTQGLLKGHTVSFNLSLASLGKLKTFGPLLSNGRERAFSNALLDTYQIRPRSSTALVEKLSGGNQQKVVLARWLSTRPRVVLLDEPTRGVDVGARAEIYSLIETLSASGSAVLVGSSDVVELIGICDRVLVLREGRIAAEFSGEDMTEENIIRAAVRPVRRDAQDHDEKVVEDPGMVSGAAL